MSLAKKCDRCGEYYTHKDVDIYGCKINAISLLDREINNSGHMTRNIVDLCPTCLESLDKWLKCEKEEKEGKGE